MYYQLKNIRLPLRNYSRYCQEHVCDLIEIKRRKKRKLFRMLQILCFPLAIDVLSLARTNEEKYQYPFSLECVWIFCNFLCWTRNDRIEFSNVKATRHTEGLWKSNACMDSKKHKRESKENVWSRGKWNYHRIVWDISFEPYVSGNTIQNLHIP